MRQTHTRREDALLAEFRSLWEEADRLWDQHSEEPAFGGYVSSDFKAVYDSLLSLQGRVSTVLEWGSGLGIVTIMASRLGYQSYGIESEPRLVAYAEDFAERYGPEAVFAHGSFIPDEFRWNPAEGDEVVRTVIDLPAAYGELDMELRDFDLIYVYPWPDERSMFLNIVRQFGRPDTLVLAYDVREGLDLVELGDALR